MPRRARITVVGAVHHVMSRGIEGKPIFRSDSDRLFFKSLLETNLARSGYLLYAWCLMGNHYHLVLRINEYPLSRFMRLVNGPYAQYFRKGQGTRGYLFQERYKSIATQDQLYLEELIRYVHLNPVRAGLCPDLAALRTYPWCGHGVLMGAMSWTAQNTHDVLNRYSRVTAEARNRHEVFLQEGIGHDPDIYTTLRPVNNGAEDMHNTGCWVIGNRDFVVKAVKEDQRNRQAIAHHASSGVGIEDIARDVCKALDVELTVLQRKGRSSPGSRARRIIAFVANRRYRIPVTTIATYLRTTSPSVSNMLRDGERLAGEVRLNY